MDAGFEDGDPSMVPANLPRMVNGANVVAEESISGSSADQKDQGKASRKVHKAEREKLKRDELNGLFLVLGSMLEPGQQNSGKACILGDTTRVLRDLLRQVESLRKENAALLTESRCVTAENNELKDEDAMLQAGILQLRDELRVKLGHDPSWSNGLSLSTTPVPHPVVVVSPLQHQQQQIYSAPPRELQLFPGAPVSPEPVPPSHLRTTQARFPCPVNSRPVQFIPSQQRTEQEQCTSGITGNSEEVSSCTD